MLMLKIYFFQNLNDDNINQLIDYMDSLTASVSKETVQLLTVQCYLYCMDYANTPVQYTAIFHGCKNDYFQMKNCEVFLIFAQNID